jgi:ribA/ribD-fused uncharacterized protein
MEIVTKEDLQKYLNEGNTVKYVFFWGHRKHKNGVSKTCFSQWYESGFEEDGVFYQTAEHYMMAGKAKLFGDEESFAKVLASSSPSEAKKIGRSVQGFEEEVWLRNRFPLVVQANRLKFSQNPELGDFLAKTGDRILVEASPVDKIWGVGLASDDKNIQNPNLWKGLNLLGFALMKVRGLL